MTTKGQRRHRFDIISDKCERCGVIKRKVPFVGNGVSGKAMTRMSFMTEYSTDGKTFTKEFINCK